MTTVNTKTAPRRSLEIRTLESLRAEVDRLAEVGESGLRVTGNWSPGQILWHVSKLIECSIDGFPNQPPAILRFIMKTMFRKRALETDQPMPTGLKLPKQASFLVPPDPVAFEEGVASIRACLDRIDAGVRMTQDSPILGPMTHDNWIRVHGKHASMHLSFIDFNP